jgi:ketosteroid isomerase-like protein
VSANLDLVRSIMAAVEREPFSPLPEEWVDPEVEWVIADGPEPSSLKGRSAARRWIRDFLSAWEGYRQVADEYRELDEERVLVLVHAGGGRGKTSELELGQHGGGGAQIFDIRDGKVMRVVTYFNRNRALADLGIPPGGKGADRPD